MGVLIRFAVVALCAAGCYAPPSLSTCKVKCATTGPACPDDATCGVDGFCHAPGDTMNCMAIVPPTSFAQIDLGESDSCGIKGDHTLWCWGANAAGQLGNGSTSASGTPVRVGCESDWQSVSAGGSHTCGIRAGGSLWCWGENVIGGTMPSTEPVEIVPGATYLSVSAAIWGYTCAIDTNHHLQCWGDGSSGQLGDGGMALVPAPEQIGAATWNAIAAGAQHTCGIQSDKSLWCWGNENGVGNLGDGMANGMSLTPLRAGAANDWEKIVVGSWHDCAINSGGELWCWGGGGEGEIGDGSGTDVYAPKRIGTASDWTDVAVSYLSTCGVHGRELDCWGRSEVGQLGDGVRHQVVLPETIEPASMWTAVGGGSIHMCAIRDDGATFCWGDNQQGQLGEGDVANQPSPVQVGSDTTWSMVSAGTYHSCGLQGDALYCWGLNAFGQLGTGDTTDHYTPVRVTGAWKNVVTGTFHTCAIDSADHLFCWGSDSLSQLGNGPRGDELLPRQVGTGTWSAIASRWESYACGISGGKLYCWGNDNFGQLGDGAIGGTQELPHQVGAATDWIAVGTGAFTTCGVRMGGTMWCWGSDAHSSMPNGAGDMDSPTPVAAGTNTGFLWTQVSLGAADGCAQDAAGHLACWGENGYGEDGNENPVELSVDTDVSAGDTWTSLGFGHVSSCALRSDHRLMCVGENNLGQLGVGTMDDAMTRVPAGGMSATWNGGSVGYEHACGIRTDGTLWCWGNDQDGQLGNGLGARLSPVPVVDGM